MNYRFWISLLLISATGFRVFAQKSNSGEARITAKIRGLAPGQWLYYSISGREARASEKFHTDSVKTGNGQFSLTISLPEGGDSFCFNFRLDYRQMSTFSLSDFFNRQLEIYLQPGEIHLTGEGPYFNSITGTGSSFVKDAVEFADLKAAALKKMRKLQDSSRTAKNTAQPDGEQQRSIQKKSFDWVIPWILKHPYSGVSAYVINSNSSIVFSRGDTATMFHYFEQLMPEAQNNVPGSIIKHLRGAVTIGKPAPDFSQPDTSGKMVSLKDFRGKYVLLDFWASWCVPCRHENPNVIKVYNAFKKRNFTVLSVSIDTRNERWLKAIHDDHLTWNHVSDLQLHNAAAEKYGITAVPSNFLIDPAGNIVAENLRGDALEKKLEEILPNK